MYNRYIPREDGTYTCKKIREPKIPDHAPPDFSELPPPEPPKAKSSPPTSKPGGASFLQQLFGKDFDTGDLLVILLLFLMAGDSEQDRSNALLTIALYFMM